MDALGIFFVFLLHFFYLSFSPKDLQLTALKGIMDIKKVLPIDGQPIYTGIRKIAQFSRLGAVFSVRNIFAELVAETKDIQPPTVMAAPFSL